MVEPDEPERYPDMCEISGCQGCLECETAEDRAERSVCGVCKNLRSDCCCEPDDGYDEDDNERHTEEED